MHDQFTLQVFQNSSLSPFSTVKVFSNLPFQTRFRASTLWFFGWTRIKVFIACL